eukprot:GHRR01005601.1.p1 GENE.GHRR01005601.1~~GHRR01005601.1.p1  ORF type:complete len:185 (+),score=41.35 GHRR01005601.1:513-1067(+)
MQCARQLLHGHAGVAPNYRQMLRPALPISAAVSRQQLKSPRQQHQSSSPSTELHRLAVVTRAQADTSAEDMVSMDWAPSLYEVDKDTFHDYLSKSKAKLVVVDFYTDRCGPCKLIYPQLVELAGELAPDVAIAKLNCNQANKELATSLGIRVAPTFHLYKQGVKVADMTGAKVDQLRALIQEHL